LVERHPAPQFGSRRKRVGSAAPGEQILVIGLGRFGGAVAMLQLDVGGFRHAVVGIGTDIEASVLSTSAVADSGVANIWAKAITRTHGRILERIGAHHVVYPEHDMGHRVAHLVGGGILDWFELDQDFAMAETVVPGVLAGRSLAELGLRSRYGVTVVAVKPPGMAFTHATPETVLDRGAIIVVAGPTRKTQEFAHLE
jgi:trk system potassium uptake protein